MIISIFYGYPCEHTNFPEYPDEENESLDFLKELEKFEEVRDVYLKDWLKKFVPRATFIRHDDSGEEHVIVAEIT